MVKLLQGKRTLSFAWFALSEEVNTLDIKQREAFNQTDYTLAIKLLKQEERVKRVLAKVQSKIYKNEKKED